ncbi:hypothetical protein L210DRAFT_3090432 [Boletus edulis BED1]|uniref:Proteasome assembly chaperone 1 n=1 Tax=Boletus edulis BED1 TaxID=1328754 RepID=A0AAD4BZT6_BOLED|nr:hypothetical protein L210DRAFT_3090432 [Boletus edulis BED1]
MEPYPLADAPPPRYAVESDDEDEYNPLSAPTRSDQPPAEISVEFKSIYDIPSKRPLVFASGEAGVSWAKIVNLGEQQAGIYVNKLQVGLLFRPSWTSAIIVVSEAETRTRLPLFAMTAYTTAIIGRLQPTYVAILDSYPTQLYISPRVISRENAPIRYLSLGKKPVLDSDLELFAPPNLLQSTTASLLNELFLRSISEDPALRSTAIILPSPKVAPPPPTTFDGKGVAADLSDTNWDRETLEKAHKWLFAIIGQEVDESSLRGHTESEPRPAVSAGMARAILGEIGEGGMYI